MLFALREHENEDGTRWLGDMVGVDYSPRSIQLAQQIDGQRLEALLTSEEEDSESQSNQEYASLHFETWDLLNQAPGDWLKGGFDIVLDKGTFDAISLMPAQGEGVQNPCDNYRESILPLIKRGSYLVITSCNWTRAELIGWLAPQGGGLSLFDEVRYPTFTFGGHTGQSVVTLVFRKDQ